MTETPAALDVAAVARALDGRWQGAVVYLPRTGSTNDEALRLAALGAPEGQVVVADEQTAGRGRRGRTWLAAPGESLLCSLVLRPSLAREDVPLLANLAGVALAVALTGQGVREVTTKWPNDVLVAGRKVAGLLLERTAAGAVVLGLGLNVAGSPPALADKATSLAACTGQTWSREQLLVLLMRELRGRYDSLLVDGAADLLAAQRSYEQTLGRRVRFRLRGQELTGRVLDLDAGGGLVVETETGPETLVSGEVELLRNMPDGD